ncbi:MAG TPA: choice-of-anchor D domain-containing protein [Solirubrobacterales bacterium]
MSPPPTSASPAAVISARSSCAATDRGAPPLDPGEGGVWALLGNGDGTFSTADRDGLESENAWAAEAGDFDGDGRPDIAALISPRGPGDLKLAIYVNDSDPALTLGGSSLDLGTAEVGEATIAPLAITNSGNYGLSVSSLSVAGGDAADFSVSGCTGAPIAPGATCDATVRFAPSQAGAAGATLTISSDDPAQPTATVALGGTGAPAPPGSGGGSGPSGPGGRAHRIPVGRATRVRAMVRRARPAAPPPGARPRKRRAKPRPAPQAG